MKEEQYNKLKTLSKLLEDKDIQSIVSEITEGYELSEEDYFVFTTENNDKITLVLDENNNLKFEKHNIDGLNIQKVGEGPIINEINYEVRPNGIIITRITKIYDYSRFSQEKKYVVDLFSESYVLTNKTLNRIHPEVILDKGYNLEELNKIIDMTTIKDTADLATTFETHMKSYAPFDGVRKAASTIYTNHTYLNGEDVSYIYDIVEGPDKLLRIYDLYNGIINKRNIHDVQSINLGLLRDSAYHLKEASGIMAQEDELVSNNISLREFYHQYIKVFQWMSPSGEVILDSRDSLIKSIRIFKCKKDDIDSYSILDTMISQIIDSKLKKIKSLFRRKTK